VSEVVVVSMSNNMGLMVNNWRLMVDGWWGGNMYWGSHWSSVDGVDWWWHVYEWDVRSNMVQWGVCSVMDAWDVWTNMYSWDVWAYVNWWSIWSNVYGWSVRRNVGSMIMMTTSVATTMV